MGQAATGSDHVGVDGVRGAQPPLRLPETRGPLSIHLLDVLTGSPESAAAESLVHEATTACKSAGFMGEDDDVQLTLYLLYELSYRGLAGVADAWEWDPRLIGARRVLEEAFERQLRERLELPPLPAPEAASVAATLFEMAAADAGPGLARFIAKRASFDQAAELLIHRSVYQLKEADPHTWAIARLSGRPKAALVEIQADEYGGGSPTAMHAALFAATMRAVGLDDTYGAYAGQVPAITLAGVNAMSMFGLQRRLRGAIVGHLAAFEMTSSIPNRLYGNGFRRLGFNEAATAYFDVHVEADAVHEQIAGHDLAGTLVEDEPHLLTDVLFGAAACLALDAWQGAWMMANWQAGRTSLRQVS